MNELLECMRMLPLWHYRIIPTSSACLPLPHHSPALRRRCWRSCAASCAWGRCPPGCMDECSKALFDAVRSHAALVLLKGNACCCPQPLTCRPSLPAIPIRLHLAHPHFLSATAALQAKGMRNDGQPPSLGVYFFKILGQMAVIMKHAARYGIGNDPQRAAMQEKAVNLLAVVSAPGSRNPPEIEQYIREAGLTPQLTVQELRVACLLLQFFVAERQHALNPSGPHLQTLLSITRQLASLEPAEPAFLLHYAQVLYSVATASGSGSPDDMTPAPEVAVACRVVLRCATERKRGWASTTLWAC